MNLLWENIFTNRKKANDIRTSLKENLLFRDLSDRELRFLESIVHVRKFHAGEPVFRQGEVGVGMYLIVAGKIDIFVTDTSAFRDENREVYITQLGPADFFGELSLVEENGRRSASAIAREESTLIGFFKPDLLEILERRPTVGTKVVFRLAQVLGQRLKETTEKVSELRRALKEITPPPTQLERTDETKASGDSPA